jgi:hypothetical protein
MFKLKTNLKSLLSFILGAVMLFAVMSSVPVAAQSINDLDILGIDCFLPGQLGCEAGNTLADQLIDFAINTAGVVAVLVLVYGGYQFFFGAVSGDQAKGRKAVTAGVVGLVIVILARPIRDLIFGVDGTGEGGLVDEGRLNNEPILNLINDQILPFLVGLSSVAAVLVIVFGGYKYMTSALSSDQKDGLDLVKNGVIGLVVILLANPIINVVRNTIVTEGEGGEESLVLDTSSIVGTAGVVINNFLVPLSSVVALFFLVLGAYYWITSNGDEGQVKKAQTSIRNAVIGLVVALLGATIVQLIIYFIPLEESAYLLNYFG